MLRASAWAAPVILTIAAAPAFAASPSTPLTVTATQTGPPGQKFLRLTFSGGTGPSSVTVTQVERGTTTITMDEPTTVPASGPAATVDSTTKNSFVDGAQYRVSYVYSGVSHVVTISTSAPGPGGRV